jgi:hypothetical protein
MGLLEQKLNGLHHWKALLALQAQELLLVELLDRF